MRVITADTVGSSFDVASTPALLQPSSRFAGQVSLARSQAELTQAFRLLYQSYLKAGLTPENSLELRVTPYHRLPTTEVFVAKTSDQVVATMTMTADTDCGLPMQKMYGHELSKLSGSTRIAEMGCFADRRDSPIRFMQVFSELSRLVVQVAQARGIGALVLAAHPRHAKFYIRTLGFQQFGGLTSCPYAQGNPAVALVMDFDRLQGSAVHQRLFGNPIDAKQLEPTQWSTDTRKYVQSLCQQQHSPRVASTRVAS